jgi:hypothetical protein
VLFSTYKTAINSNQSIVYLGILGHFLPISSNNTASNNPTTSSSNSVANGDNSSTPITPQPTASNLQSQSTDQSNTYAEPTFKDADISRTPSQTYNDGTVMVTGKDGSFMLPFVVVISAFISGDSPDAKTFFPPSPISPINFDIPASQADALAVYYYNSFTFLGPRGWEVSNVDISADGEIGIDLISSDGSNEWMEIWYHVGMGMVSAYQLGQWVPGMQAWASQQATGFAYKPFLYPITFVSLGSHSQGFSYMGDPPYTTNGVNDYNITGQNTFFSQEFITLPDSSHALETIILNFFLEYTMRQ